MPTPTKTGRTLVASQSLGAGSSITGTAIDLSTAWGLAVTIAVTNGASAPTTGCTASLLVRRNGTGNWFVWVSATAGLAASGVYYFGGESWRLPPEISEARVDFGGHAGNAVTVEAIGHELTSF